MSRTIEVSGIWRQNLGSVLMLSAISDAVSGHEPSVELAIAVQRGDRVRGSMGVRKLDSRADAVLHSIAGGVPSSVRGRFGVAVDRDVDAVLDASGFAYGDAWGLQKLERRLLRRLGEWKGREVPLVLLPQAFGPFTGRGMRAAIEEVANYAKLIYARDRVSLGHLRGAVGELVSLRRAPDFTVLLSGRSDPRDERLSGRPCFVPNQKMVATRSASAAALHLNLAADVLRNLLRRGERPFLILHESADLAVATAILNILGEEVELVYCVDAIRTKGILGASSLVVGARFHALVSSLSQGVPSIAMGWSHKYPLLLEDYGVPWSFLDDQASSSKVSRILDQVLDVNERREIRAILRRAAKDQRNEARTMWTQVTTAVDLNGSA